MKHIQTTMFKALVFTFAFWISQSMTALTIDGIVYQLNPSLKTASVVRKNAGNSSLPGWYYSGYIKIPSEVVYNDVTYTVTTIEEKAFGSCTELTAIKIPESITTIGAQAFLGCIGLTFVTIPNSVTSIGDYAFGGCSGLKTIDIPNNVKTIGIGAFSYCTSATSIAISENITSIPESAFANCSCLTSINIPNKVEKIGARAFEGCRDLTSVTIGNGVTTIDVGAFSKCSSMTSINIPNNVMNINQDVFKECIRLKSMIIEDGEKALKMYPAYYIESLYIGRNIVHPFTKVNSLQSVTIGNSVTSIDAEAFKECGNLSSVTIGNGVTTIGDGVFRGCSNLSSITIGNGITSIGKSAFSGCTGLTSVHINDLVAWCKINFSQYTCNPLCYAHHLFLDGEEVKDLVIPEGITEIKAFAFTDCSELTSVTFPENLKSIGDHAFRNCTGLTSVKIPESVTSLSGFAGCSGLTSIEIPSSVTSLSGFTGCTGLTSIVIPNSVTSFGGLSGCTGLKSVSIGSGISIIPSKAFKDCSNLKDVYCYIEEVPSTPTDAFENTNLSGMALHVPEEAVNEYKMIAPWSQFGKIVAIKPAHTLTYMLEGEVYKKVEVEEGEEISAEVPVKEGHTFSGWTDLPTTMPTKDVTVTGSFSINNYMLIYMVDNNEYKTIDVEYGASITPEAEPIKEGYTFSGWSLIPEKMPADDVIITGSFTKGQFKLTYILNGETYKTISMDFGTSITAEEEPTKEGYTFSGWSEIPAKMPAGDVTITGSFTINKYKLTYMVDGNEYKSFDVEFGSAITPEAAPTKESYTFSGWSEIPETMPAKDVIVTGSFTFVDALEDVIADEGEYQIYTLEGKQVENLQKGVNIIKYKDGSVKKVIVK